MIAKRISYLAVFVAGIVAGPGLGSDQIPGAPQKNPILIRNATLHTVSGGTLPSTCLLIRDGKIAEIAPSIPDAEGYEVIDATGKHVFPGLIDSHSNLGLVEIDSIKASIDTTETGTTNPNVRAAMAVNPDSEAIPVARANGVLISLVVPAGGLVSGRASLMELDGWTWEDMTLREDAAMMVVWPRWDSRARGPRDEAAKAAEEPPVVDRLEPFHTLLRETRDYAAARSADPKRNVDLRLEAMIPVVEGRMPILVAANSVKQIQTVIAFAKRNSLQLIIFGGADAMHCVDLIREAKVPVVISSIYRLPPRRDAAYDSMYALPSQLKAAGIQFSIASEGRFGASAVRNLPYNAAAAIAFGLSSEDALRSITLSPAEIYGVADRVGSLEVGKDATIIVCDGDILETPTQVEKAWIQGRKVDLSSKHTLLYDKYNIKYERQK